MSEAVLSAEIHDVVRSVGKVGATVLLTADTRFVEDLNIDSLDLVAVFLGVQDRVGVVIDDEDVPALKTVGDLVAYVGRRAESMAA